jgi:uncharacterized delta-60 repeat protein
MQASYKSPILAISLFFALAASISAAPGDLDPSFGNGGIVISPGGPINPHAALGMALQADGKIVAVGYGAAGGSSWDFAVARYSTDGSPDTSFGGSGVVVTPLSNFDDFALSVAIQADGKIVVAGVGGGGGFAVVRYNPNGSLDTTFNGTGKVFTQINASNYARSVATQSDGKIVVAGESYDSSTGGFTLVRYNTNGSLDTSFDNDGIVTTKVGNAFSSAYAVAIQADGKIVAAGNSSGGLSLVRYNADGSLDTTFNGTGIVTNPGSPALSVAIQADGKILTANGLNGLNSENRLVRYNANGTPDTSFGGTGSVATGIFVNSVVLQANGKIVAAGFTEFGEGTAFAVIRLNGNGSHDATFGGTGTIITPIVTQVYYGSFANSVAIQPDGKIVAAGGVVDRAFDLFDFALVRYQGDSAAPPSCPNPIDCADFFVRQHYRDFLNREPDADGLAFWTSEIAFCGSDQQCVEAKRINVSAAYFLSIEFQQSGYLVYRFYKAAFGNLPGAPVPVRLSDFLPDAQALGQGVIVNQGNWQQQLETNKQNFANAFVQRAAFTSAYPTSMSPDAFVDTLFANAGVIPSSSERAEAVAEFGSAANTADVAARARALRRVAENGTLGRQEFNRAFVLMQYFGYLRRNPNDAPEAGLNFDGYNFWLNKLNQFNGNFQDAEMVKAFIISGEYRQRFGQ